MVAVLATTVALAVIGCGKKAEETPASTETSGGAMTDSSMGGMSDSSAMTDSTKK
jgi:hypothetical protein